ncbi:hypothetical protein Trydic_g4703, partial [Trypoxylus dichotomus]
KRLNKNPPLKQEYGEFIKEYLELGHMRKAKLYNYSTEPHFYLPHHAVVKENSITTRLRVVFDGSAKTSSGVSLNDTLMVEPKLQQDLFDIVCRFRLYAYVITADVAKMYRQVRINEQCMPFQRILWRMSDKSDVEIFELTTVTYGTASASYLATKTFVANRIAEIQELTNVADWHHIGTKENPADFLSRGTTSSTLMHTNLWWHGPKFLQCSTSNWPDSEFTLTENLPEYYLMGDLSQHRLTPGKAFENIGVDYFGPVHIRDSMKRKHNLIKAYGAVFVCFATKAVHVELVGNLSTEAFLAALKRFVARRGSISNIYSDNGTQFIGANTELKKLLKQLQTQTQTEQVKAYMAHNGTRWHFIPPRSPHFGGLWEAAK